MARPVLRQQTAALIATKRNVDPDNLFHHEMSIPLVAPQA